MKGVRFGNYHSYEDFSLILTGKTIPLPSAKTEYVDIAGGNGTLDLTEYFGFVSYNNRKLSFSFQTKLRRQAFYEMFEELSNALHGKRMKIYLDEDLYFYFVGRLNVNPYKSNEKIGSIVIDAECEPFKLEEIETRYQFNLNGNEIEGDLINLKMRVTPTIEVVTNESITLIYNNTSYVLTSGTYTIPEMVLEEGSNLVTMQGVGKISFIYRRGKL